MTAHVFAAAGMRVALFERARIGFGSTGASTAMLMHTPDRFFSELTTRYGRQNARERWRLSQSALVAGARLLQKKLRHFYPELTPPAIAYAWDGLFATTADGLPNIGPHPLYPRQLFVLGYGGNGMAFGSLAARILLRHCINRQRRTDRLFGFDRD